MARKAGKKAAKKATKGGKNSGKNSGKTEPVNVQELRERVRSVVAESDLARKLLDGFHFPASLPAEDDGEAELAVPAGVGKDSVE